MRSYSRNSRKPYSLLGVAAAVSLLLGTAAQAAEPHNFVLTAYSNGAGGAELVAGDYQAATAALHSSHSGISSFDPSTLSNNRCVALAVTKQWDTARTACDQAVREAQQEKALLPSYQYWARKLKNDYLAVALSNRAVVRFMSSDADAATSDLKRAEALSPKADFVMRNRAAIDYSRTAVAKVAIAVAPASH
jgi:tetratricopeptide (TPR) repeat protein